MVRYVFIPPSLSVVWHQLELLKHLCLLGRNPLCSCLLVDSSLVDMLDVVQLSPSLVDVGPATEDLGNVVHYPLSVEDEELVSEWISLGVFDQSLDVVGLIHLVLVGVVESDPTIDG